MHLTIVDLQYALNYMLQDGRPEVLQLVKYDRRLANYFSSVGAGVRGRGRERPRNTLFLAHEAATDMGILAFPRLGFWGSLLLLLLAVEVRMHVHYSASFAWLFLWARPVYLAKPGPFRWEIMYSPTSTSSLVEIGALCAGPLAVFFLWLVTVGVVWVLSKVTTVDHVTYRFVGLLGLVASFDWVLTLAVDLATLSYQVCS